MLRKLALVAGIVGIVLFIFGFSSYQYQNNQYQAQQIEQEHAKTKAAEQAKLLTELDAKDAHIKAQEATRQRICQTVTKAKLTHPECP